MNENIRALEQDLDNISIQVNEFRKINEDLKKKIARFQAKNPQNPFDYENIHFNDSLVFKEMERRGITLKYIPQTHLIEAKYNSHVEYLFNTISRLVSHVDALVLEDKFTTKQLLKEKGFPVADGAIFDMHQIYEALSYARDQLRFPVVIKPTNGSGGSFVYCNLQSESEFRRAYSALSKVVISSSLLVEKFQENVADYRFLFIGGKVVSIVKRTPPTLVGNGYSTILQLVEAENTRRMNPRNTCLCPIQIDDIEGERCLKTQGVTYNTILEDGEKVQCRFNANVSMGGECETVKSQVHPSYFDIATRILQLFPNLSLFTVDFLIQDPSVEPLEGNYWICECGCINPGLSLHTHPSIGKGDDIISPLVDLLYPETALK